MKFNKKEIMIDFLIALLIVIIIFLIIIFSGEPREFIYINF